MMRILVAEDDAELGGQLQRSLQYEGYSTDLAVDGAEAYFLATQCDYDMAIIDLGLPKVDGMALITQLRNANFNFPILILTARNTWQSKVAGLDVGADDYLVKPFQIEELLARLNALKRRTAGFAQSEITQGPLTLNLKTKRVQLEGVHLDLTAFEYKILEYFMLHPQQIVSKMQLIDHLYEQDFDRDSNVIEVFIARLRRKLDPHNQYDLIETLRGRGYLFEIAKYQRFLSDKKSS